MITKVSSVSRNDLQSAKKAQHNSNVTIPSIIQNKVNNYSAENVKAVYTPSFGANVKNYTLAINKDGKPVFPEKQNLIAVNSMKPEKRIKGEYYNELSDDVAIMLGTERHMLLEKEQGVSTEIFAHNFADRVNKGVYEGMGLEAYNTDVIYIKDLYDAVAEDLMDMMKAKLEQSMLSGRKPDMETVEEGNPLMLIPNLSAHGPENTVIIMDDFSTLNSLIQTTKFKSAIEYIEKTAPNVSMIGVVDKEMLDQGPRDKAMAVMNMMTGAPPEDNFDGLGSLELKGLSTNDAKEFLTKNKKYMNNVFKKHKPQADLKLSKQALSQLVDISAVRISGALPETALKVLDMVAVAKLNETKEIPYGKPLLIKANDIDKFFENHSALVDGMKPDSGRFSLAENVKTKLSDVGGISSIKEDIQDDLISYLKNPKTFIEKRGTAPKGVLLEGPPGTGKTLLARAIAGETNTPFISASGSEFVEKYVGVGAQRVRELFATARSAAANSSNHTAIVFIDEFDALARARSGGDGGGNREAEQTLNQLLTEMDGFNNKEAKNKVIVIAATNRKDMLDKAAIRAGRFDDNFTVSNPRTNVDRLEILNIHSKNLKFESDTEKAKILAEVSKLTDGMSGAELAGVMNKAKRVVSKREDNKFVTYDDIVEGYLQTIAGPVQKNAEERPFEDIVKTVRHEAGHAAMIDLLSPMFDEKISFITLDSRGDFLGAVFHHSPHVNPNFKSVVLSAAVSYAGGLAEPSYAKEGYAAGVRGDLEHVTNLFNYAIQEAGLGVYTPPLSLKNNPELKDIYRKENAKDFALMSATSLAIAKISNEFQNKFLNEYVERFKANAGKGGNNLSGEQFSKLRQEWLVKTGYLKEQEVIRKKIWKIVDNAFNKNTNIFQKVSKTLIKTV